MIREVSIAVILINRNDKYLIGLRSYGLYKNCWEFPSVIVNQKTDQTHDFNSLRYAVEEKYNLRIEPQGIIRSIEYPFPDLILRVRYCFCFLTEVQEFNEVYIRTTFYNPQINKNYEWASSAYDTVNYLRGLHSRI